MRLATLLMYDGNPRKAADEVVALERAGLDSVWVAEAYGFDAPTLMGYLAATTETVQIGSGILNIYSRTPGALLQTAAGLDNVSQGRAILGLGVSGPQVVEGFHGVPYRKPMARTAEVVDLVRRGLRREPLTSDGVFHLPLGKEHGGITPLGLPDEWRVLVHDALLDEPVVVLGSGVRRSKLLVPGRLLADLPGAEVVAGLGR